MKCEVEIWKPDNMGVCKTCVSLWLVLCGNALIINIDNIDDRFAFFTGDGTPLNEAYEGYDLILKNYGDNNWQVLLYAEGGGDKKKHKEMADQLMEGKPYIAYTGEDGITQTFPLS